MLLITPSEVVQTAFSSQSQMESALVRPSKIDVAQENFIRPKIGDALFDKLCDGSYPDLTDRYIKSPLAYFTRYILLDELAIQVNSNGLTVFSGDNSLAATTESSTDTKTENATITDSQNSSATANSTFDETKTSKDTHLNDVSQTESSTKSFTGSVTKTSTEDVTNTTITGGTIVDKSIADTDRDNHSETLEATTGAKTTDSTDQTDTSKITSTKEESAQQNGSKSTQAEQEAVAKAQRNIDNQRQLLIPASQIQLQSLQTRALADANVLMRKAIRHIENNPELYPEYVRNERFYF